MQATTTIPTSSSTAGSSRTDTELARYIAAVAEEGDRFASVADAGDLDVPIAACPGWDVRELVKHVGMVHLWAAANIAFPSDRWLHVDELADLQAYWPDHTAGWPDDRDLVDWYRSTVATLVDVLRSTASDHQCLTFLPAPSPLVMWARRQASEIAVHRFDAEFARGRASSFDAHFAADMLDELLVGFAGLVNTAQLQRDHVLHVAVDDVGDDLYVDIGPSGIRADREARPADLRLSGTAADLYVLLWNRPAGGSIHTEGDVGVLDVWHDTCRIEWL